MSILNFSAVLLNRQECSTGRKLPFGTPWFKIYRRVERETWFADPSCGCPGTHRPASQISTGEPALRRGRRPWSGLDLQRLPGAGPAVVDSEQRTAACC